MQYVAERSINSFESKIWLLRREVLRILAERHFCELQQTRCHAITNIQRMVCTADNFTAFRTRAALHCPSTLTNSVGMAVFALKREPSA